jgi:hypothetical protein
MRHLIARLSVWWTNPSVKRPLKKQKLGSIGILVEQSGGRKLILWQPSNGLGVNVKKEVELISTFRCNRSLG